MVSRYTCSRTLHFTFLYTNNEIRRLPKGKKTGASSFVICVTDILAVCPTVCYQPRACNTIIMPANNRHITEFVSLLQE